MIQSNGVLLKTPSTTIWQGRPDSWPGSLDLGFRWASYASLYRSHSFLAAGINKIANAAARLPLKVYERGDDDDRSEARDSAYALLLRRPNDAHDQWLFWSWTVSTLMIYGEAFWGKVRDRGGRPVELLPMHPTNVHDEFRDGRIFWRFDNGTTRVDNIDRRDLVHFRFYNPDSMTRGMSLMEPLRATLENEEGARRANSALWRNGGRPSIYLKTEKTLSEPAQQRLAAQWSQLHGGVDNWAKAAVLEEGMEAQVVSLNAEELQYVSARELNRDEILSVVDVPPPAVHDLRRATFSNVTEQNRSLYRDTMPPKLGLLESTMEFELRDGRFGREGEPDFGDAFYAEFLMDEVLRGDFEVRIPAIAQAIQTGQMTPNEGRRIENRARVEGGDSLLINAALVKVEPESDDVFDTFDLDRVNAVGQLIRAGFEPQASAAALGLPAIPHTGLPPVAVQAEPLDANTVRALMGRLSRQKTLDDVDGPALVEGLNGHTDSVLAALGDAQAEGLTLPEFRGRLRALTVKE